MIAPKHFRKGVHLVGVADYGHPHVLPAQLQYLPVLAVEWLELIENLQPLEDYFALDLLVVEQVEDHFSLVDVGREYFGLVIANENCHIFEYEVPLEDFLLLSPNVALLPLYLLLDPAGPVVDQLLVLGSLDVVHLPPLLVAVDDVDDEHDDIFEDVLALQAQLDIDVLEQQLPLVYLFVAHLDLQSQLPRPHHLETAALLSLARKHYGARGKHQRQYLAGLRVVFVLLAVLYPLEEEPPFPALERHHLFL